MTKVAFRESLHRQKELKKLIRNKKKQLSKAPEGHLQITGGNETIKYYWMRSGDFGTGTYLGKNDLKQAKKLAQKSYDRKVLSAAERELQAWQQLAKLLPGTTAEEVYETLSPARQALVTPIQLTDEEYRKQWEAVTWEPGRFQPGAAEFWTDRGERVRSKSEQLIANLLYRLGIPYRYEYPLEVFVDGRKKVWRPDFMILDVPHRKEFFLEHLGMLDDGEYGPGAKYKIMAYEQNGLYEGRGMYYTFETKAAPLDIRYVEQKVLRILEQEGGGLPEERDASDKSERPFDKTEAAIDNSWERVNYYDAREAQARQADRVGNTTPR